LVRKQSDIHSGKLLSVPIYFLKSPHHAKFYWTKIPNTYSRKLRKVCTCQYDLNANDIEKTYQKALTEENWDEYKRTDMGIDFTRWRLYGHVEIKRDVTFEYIL